MDSTTLRSLLPPPEALIELDLDTLRQHLDAAATAWAALEGEHRLYETELQRELRAKIDLAGPTASCPTPEAAFTMSGLALLAARRDAMQKFNQVYSVAPLRRNASNPSHPGAPFEPRHS